MPATSTEAIPIGSPNRSREGVSNDDDFSHSIEMFSSEEIRRVENEAIPMAAALARIDPRETFPLQELPGEVVEMSLDINSCYTFCLTNYRIVIASYDRKSAGIVPNWSVGKIDLVNSPRAGVNICCRNGRMIKLFCENEVQMEVHKKLQKSTCILRTNDAFTWRFTRAVKAMDTIPNWLVLNALGGDAERSVEEEFERLKFCTQHWRISYANANYSVCETYPKALIIPADITDDELRLTCAARNNLRFPTAVWRYGKKDTVLMRSSQPCCGIFNWRYPLDEKLLDSARKATIRDESNTRLLITDCRSYTAALANRMVKGGGAESEGNYTNSNVEFMGLPNIHYIRESLQNVRSLLAGPRDPATFLSGLQSTLWFQYILDLINASHRCVRALVDEGHTVLVHCTDGWDRTTQVISLTKLIADPYYRTIRGFKNLIQHDWIDFGHKFADRTGARSTYVSNEESPVFLQWLDCVHQLHRRYPDAFEFTLSFLSKLAQHCYSGLFGTFMFNSQRDRSIWKCETVENCESGDLLSVWSFLNGNRPEYVNVLYDATREENRQPLLIDTSLNIEDFVLWKNVFIGSSIERRICTNQCTGQNSDADRISMHRSHSAESLSNLDSSFIQAGTSANSSFSIFNPHSQNGLRLPDGSVESVQLSRNNSRTCTTALMRRVDPDGLTNLIEILDVKTRRKCNELEAKVRRLERRIREIEQPRLSASSTAVEVERRSFGEASSASCSVESMLSGISMIDKDDASDISDGSKGWLLDTASQNCMACHQTFFLNNRKHHCRNCGRIYCARCTSQSYHRVHDNKGENVRVCNDCYSAMTTGRLISGNGPVGVTSQGRSTSHETPAFIVGTSDGQTVYG